MACEPREIFGFALRVLVAALNYPLYATWAQQDIVPPDLSGWPEGLITRNRLDFDFCRFNSRKPTPGGWDRKREANPSITRVARDRETAESLGQNRGVRGLRV